MSGNPKKKWWEIDETCYLCGAAKPSMPWCDDGLCYMCRRIPKKDPNWLLLNCEKATE